MNDVQQGQPTPQASSLAPRFIKGLNADFVPATWPGQNDSGLAPYGHYVLVKMDQCAATSAGGIMLTDEMKDRMDEAAETGCIYALGGAAFNFFENGRAWTGPKPEAGDRVYIEKYAGVKARGQDGSLFRIMAENCIAAGLARTEETV